MVALQADMCTRVYFSLNINLKQDITKLLDLDVAVFLFFLLENAPDADIRQVKACWIIYKDALENLKYSLCKSLMSFSNVMIKSYTFSSKL